MSAVEKLQQLGLTEYEAEAYLALLTMHLSTATKVAEKSGVPRTKIYSVLQSLNEKGWIHIYSGVPLLFKAINPQTVFERVKENYTKFLDATQMTLKEGMSEMKEKFIIKKFDIGVEKLKEEIKKARTVEINNTTAGFINKVSRAFQQDAKVKVLLFPGEAKPNNMKNVEFKEAEIAIVSIVRNKEVPSMSITLDENRTFTVFQDPVDHNYIVDEMLYDECSRCFSEWSNLSWNSDTQK
jgi:sugar-specific transcriptional regulator TrmB